MADALLTLDQVAGRLHKHPKTLRKLLPDLMDRMPALRARKLGRTLMFTEHDFEDLVQAIELVSPGEAVHCLPPQPARTLPQVWSVVFARARRNAVVRKIAFELTQLDQISLVDRSDNRCEVSGIFFDRSIIGVKGWAPYAPSLDRIDAAGCYTPSNCRLVCCAVNVALGSWGDEVLLNISRAIVRKHGAGDV